MKYADLKLNDITNCISGICVSVWLQGCPHKCKGCHNPQTWDINGGKDIVFDDFVKTIIDSIRINGIKRDLSILGGEPLSDENCIYTKLISEAVKKSYPDIKICLWTGYTLNELKKSNKFDFIENIDFLIDGQFELEHRDITLKLRGSPNQRVYKLSKFKLDKLKFEDITDKVD